MKQSFIDSLQHRVLARAMGVRRSSSSLALQVEAGVEPLTERRRFLTARTYSKLLRSDINAGRLVRNHRDRVIAIHRSPRHRSFCIRVQQIIHSQS
jgi:hypothetical protein